MQVQRVDSRTLRYRGDPCHSLKAPYGHVVSGAAFSNTFSRSTFSFKKNSITCTTWSRYWIEGMHHGSS